MRKDGPLTRKYLPAGVVADGADPQDALAVGYRPRHRDEIEEGLAGAMASASKL